MNQIFLEDELFIFSEFYKYTKQPDIKWKYGKEIDEEYKYLDIIYYDPPRPFKIVKRDLFVFQSYINKNWIRYSIYKKIRRLENYDKLIKLKIGSQIVYYDPLNKIFI